MLYILDNANEGGLRRDYEAILKKYYPGSYNMTDHNIFYDYLPLILNLLLFLDDYQNYSFKSFNKLRVKKGKSEYTIEQYIKNVVN